MTTVHIPHEEKTQPSTPDAKKKVKEEKKDVPSAPEEKNPAFAALYSVDGNATEPASAFLEQIKISMGFNSRKVFDEEDIRLLAADIAENGLKQPLGVIRVGPKTFELISGERRYRALTSLKWPHPIRVEVHLSLKTFSAQKLENLAENIFRKQIRTCDQARELAQLETEEKVSRESMAKRTGFTVQHVGVLIRCWTKLHPKIIALWTEPKAQAEIPLKVLTLWSQAPHEAQLKKLEDYLAPIDDDEEIEDDSSVGGGDGAGSSSKGSGGESAPKLRAKGDLKNMIERLEESQQENPTERRGAYIRALRWALGLTKNLR